jgi:uncharacterized protein
MTNTEIIEQTIAFVKRTLQDAEGGHDWFHIQRVFNTALFIAKEENADLMVIGLGALLHDIADAKFHNGDETIGPGIAKTFLESLQVDENTISHVVKIIEHVSFKSSLGSNQKNSLPFNSKELQIIQDADRLDALGAIGIARAFNYGGFRNRPLYNPDIAPDLCMTKEAYKASTAPTINHFYEKLLLLKDKMNTPEGKRLAEERHNFILQYLEQFYKEWNSEV